MAQLTGFARTADRAGSLLAAVGMILFFPAILSVLPRMLLFPGIALILLSFVAFFLSEFGPGAKQS